MCSVRAKVMDNVWGDEVEMSVLVAVEGENVAVVGAVLKCHILWGDAVLSSGGHR